MKKDKLLDLYDAISRSIMDMTDDEILQEIEDPQELADRIKARIDKTVAEYRSYER